jgi:hypothetical protein
MTPEIHRILFGHLMFFQRNRLHNEQKNNNTFDYSNVKDVWIELDERRYPEEPLNVDFKNKYYCSSYGVLLNLKNTFIKPYTPPYFEKKRKRY